jgi:UDP-GlcNAc:undecaprenyl-phosphate GlcNAc-1-phosphate transferase
MPKPKDITGAHLVAWTAWGSLLLPQVRQVFTGYGLRWTYILLFSSLLSFLLTPIVRRIAVDFAILDQPCDRKVHKEPTALLGGLSIYIAFTTSMLANNILDSEVIGILVASTAVMIVSLVDDIKSLPARLKLVAQLAATAFVFLCGIRITVFHQHGVGEIANILLSFMWVVGVTNAMNFVDGTDGLATGLGVIISFFLGIVAFQTDQPFLGWFAIAMMGSCLGFLPYNFRHSRPARIFLGDTGSTFIGFTLACLAIKGDWAEHDPIVSICAPIMIFGVLIFDMTHTTVSRIITGKVRSFHDWVSYVGKDHIHHRMYRLFQSNKKTVFLILAMSTCLGISAIVLRNARTVDGILIIVQGIMAFIIFSAIDYQQERRTIRFETTRSSFRIQQLFDVVVGLPDAGVKLDAVILDISACGARVLTRPTTYPVHVGTNVLLSSMEFCEAELPVPKGRIVRKRQLMLNEDNEKYMEFGVEFTDFENENILKIIEYLYRKQIEKRQEDFINRIRPRSDMDLEETLRKSTFCREPACVKHET